jgi:uncharacterized membrane protein
MSQDTIRELLSRLVEEGSSKGAEVSKKSGGALSGVKGVAAGAGAAALAPLAARGIGKLVKGAAPDGLSDFAEKLTGQSGGGGGAVTDALKSALPFGGGDGDGGGGSGDKNTVPGVGKGRRMPVQQEVDIGAPIETVYNQFTQFELWPRFMHRVTDVSQQDKCTLNFSTKIWGKKKEFVARIETQRPNERIKWKVDEGIAHTGVVTFHELGPRLTRVLVGLDLEPGGMLEKAARGLRHVKRAVRADLHRFKAFIEVQEVETGAWRGVIEHGKVVEDHDQSYDKDREYSKFDDVFKGPRSKKPTAAKASSGDSRSGSRGTSKSGSSSRGTSKSGSSSRGTNKSGSSSRGSTKSGSSSRGTSKSSSSRRTKSGSGSSTRTRGATNGGSGGSSRGRSRSASHSEGRSRRRS